jgi:hypothetical protein
VTKDWNDFTVSSRTRDPKPLSTKSEWVDQPREHFTAHMQRLFAAKQPSMSGIGPGQTWTKTAP